MASEGPLDGTVAPLDFKVTFTYNTSDSKVTFTKTRAFRFLKSKGPILKYRETYFRSDFRVNSALICPRIVLVSIFYVN